MGSIKGFDKPQRLIDWGRKGIEDSLAVFGKFIRDETALSTVVQFDPDTREQVKKIVQLRDIDGDIERFATEALNNIRHSFDQSIFAAHVAIGLPRKDGHYPWAQTPADLEFRLKGNKAVTTVADGLWDTIRRHEPYYTGQGYPGGNDEIRQLAHAANSKHTIGFALGCRTSGIRNHFTEITSLQKGESLTILPPRWDPVNKEVILERVTGVIDPTVAKTNGKYDVGFYVAFDETVPLQKRPAHASLQAFADKAQDVLDTLKACSIELGAS